MSLFFNMHMILKNLILVDFNKNCRDSFENSSIGCPKTINRLHYYKVVAVFIINFLLKSSF